MKLVGNSQYALKSITFVVDFYICDKIFLHNVGDFIFLEIFTIFDGLTHVTSLCVHQQYYLCVHQNKNKTKTLVKVYGAINRTGKWIISGNLLL